MSKMKAKNEKEQDELDNLSEISEANCTEMDKNFTEKLKEDLQDQKLKTNEYLEHLKRTMADFDNYKKRITKEKELLYGSILADLVSDILPVLDSFENALKIEATGESNTFKTGMDMIYGQFRDVLNKFNVEEISGVTSTFNPELHEAVMHAEDSNYGPGEIIEVFRKGYKIGDKVIRHSMVKVAN